MEYIISQIGDNVDRLYVTLVHNDGFVSIIEGEKVLEIKTNETIIIENYIFEKYSIHKSNGCLLNKEDYNIQFINCVRL